MLLFWVLISMALGHGNQVEFLLNVTSHIDPRLPHISATPRGVYANARGLAILKEQGINYTRIERALRPKTVEQLYDWNCTHCTIFSLGNSINGHPLLGARLTNNPGAPKFFYGGTIHGDETVGRYVLARLIEELDRTNATVLNHLDIYIVPCLNPDGFLRGTRSNARGFDLNRNFPDQFGWQTRPMQPETRAIMQFMQQHNFSIGANLHTGDIVANYGFDGNRQHRSGVYCATPDDATLRFISSVYAKNHYRMRHSREFPAGITNGCDWYVLYGGLQDWAYLHAGQYHITLELAYVKDPTNLVPYWIENRKALYAFMNLARQG